MSVVREVGFWNLAYFFSSEISRFCCIIKKLWWSVGYWLQRSRALCLESVLGNQFISCVTAFQFDDCETAFRSVNLLIKNYSFHQGPTMDAVRRNILHCKHSSLRSLCPRILLSTTFPSWWKVAFPSCADGSLCWTNLLTGKTLENISHSFRH